MQTKIQQPFVESTDDDDDGDDDGADDGDDGGYDDDGFSHAKAPRVSDSAPP